MHARVTHPFIFNARRFPMALMFPRLAPQLVRTGTSPRDEPTLERALAALAPAESSNGPAVHHRSLRRRRRGDRRKRARALGRKQVQAFAVEYEAERARHARQLVDRCIHGDLMDTLISRQELRPAVAQPAVWRPVQGHQTAMSATRARAAPGLEKLFYQKALPLLQYGGVLIYIVPHYVLDAELVGWLTRHFADLRIYRAVEAQFKQVVIFGRRVRQRDQASDSVKATRALLLQIGQGDAEAEELPVEWPFLPYTVPASPAEPEHFYRVTMEPEQFAEEVGPAARAPGRRSIRTWAPHSNRCGLRRGPCRTGILPWRLLLARSPAW